jgi:histidine ammonia-lyase
MPKTLSDDKASIALGLRPLTIEDVVALARGTSRIAFDSGTELHERIDANARKFARRLESGEKIYGVTTGFGESCLNSVPEGFLHDLSRNLVQFHGCGTGPMLSDEESAAVIAVCLASLTSGWSAVRPAVIERLCALLDHRILPCVPSQGSVGASGDLTPLSYVAAALLGEREVTYRGRQTRADAALVEAGLDPIDLMPKESLAVMNGTSVMTGLLCLAHHRARRLGRLAAALTAMASDVMGGNRSHFDDRIFAAKPHPGQRACARWVRQDIEYRPPEEHQGRIQDRYSVRCAPHVIGVLLDALAWMRPWLETELNGANYNPLVDPETGDILHGGNFYGGHACFVADGMKNAIANVADLLDRQLALLCSPVTSNGLPENLVGREGDDRAAHHGFKAMQIAASALAAEALKLTMPASVFSRSTESHNQDKVSMGTIAARDCIQVLQITETVSAICTLALCQAVDLRRGENCHGRSVAMREAVRRSVPFNDGDRRQDFDIQRVLDLLRADQLPIGEIDFG